MKELLSTFFNLSAQEYDVFLHMPRRTRLVGAFGLACIYSVMVILVYLAFLPSMQEDPDTASFTFGLMGVVAVTYAVGLLPIVFPRLLDYRKHVTLALMLAAGFGGALVSVTYAAGESTAEPGALVALAVGILVLTLGLALYGRIMKNVAGEKARLESEMRLAQSIHARLLPAIERDMPRYHLHARARLATEVGGDFFDVVDNGDAQLTVAIGDVAGHDVAAGLMMATTKGVSSRHPGWAGSRLADAGLEPHRLRPWWAQRLRQLSVRRARSRPPPDALR